MIVCSCNIITRREIEQVIVDLLRVDPWRVIVPLQVYHAMRKRGRCCGCFPGVTRIIVETTEHYHRQLNTPEREVVTLIDRLRREHETCETARMLARARMQRLRVA